jgi:ABC-type uncharacterized transport system auxiliary subunit
LDYTDFFGLHRFENDYTDGENNVRMIFWDYTDFLGLHRFENDYTDGENNVRISDVEM